MLLVVLIVICCFFVRKTAQAKTKVDKFNYLLCVIFVVSIACSAMKIFRDNFATIEYHTGQLILMPTNVSNEEYYYAELTDDGFLCFSGINDHERYKVCHSNCRVEYDSTEYFPYATYSEATYSYDPSISLLVDFGLFATKSRTEKNYVLIVPFGTIMTEAEISLKSKIIEHI